MKESIFLSCCLLRVALETLRHIKYIQYCLMVLVSTSSWTHTTPQKQCKANQLFPFAVCPDTTKRLFNEIQGARLVKRCTVPQQLSVTGAESNIDRVKWLQIVSLSSEIIGNAALTSETLSFHTTGPSFLQVRPLKVTFVLFFKSHFGSVSLRVGGGKGREQLLVTPPQHVCSSLQSFLYRERERDRVWHSSEGFSLGWSRCRGCSAELQVRRESVTEKPEKDKPAEKEAAAGH